MNQLESKLREYEEYLKIIDNYNNASNLLYWDMSTYMPEEAADNRAEIMSFMSIKAHELSVSDKMGEFAEYFNNHIEELDDVHKRMAFELKKNYEKEKRYPSEFIKQMSLAASKGQVAWQKAKINNDFDIFKPVLESLVYLTKQGIEYKGYKDNKYDALLDDFEPGLTVKQLDKVFGELRDGIVQILDKIKKSSVKIDNSFLKRDYPEDKQRELCLNLLHDMGFDFKRGRMDETEHPYTLNMTNKDVRITNHYYRNEFASAVFSAIHEGGHAIYEQDIPDYLEGTGLNVASSMAVHESQSRYYENLIGRSREYCSYLFKEASKIFPEQLFDVTEEEFYRAINSVRPSLIRTEADELTYSIHIIIRYEIEKLLINDKITVDDLPRVWNEKYMEYLGVEPLTDREGVLQDMHWSDGSFGYFPSYALGNLYGAQMRNKMIKDIPNVYEEVERGNLAPVHEWLKKNVHECANLYDPSELIKNITGEDLNAKYFLEYLDNKYKEIYKY